VYEITVRATDSGGLFDERAVQLTLTAAPAVASTPTPAPAPADGSIALPASGAASGGAALPTQLPPAPASLPWTPAPAPLGPQFAERPLGLPVDGAVPAANLGSAGLPGAAPAGAPSVVDLNALPPTAAGPVEMSTFSLVRLSPHEAASHLRLTGGVLPPDAGGHRLFVYHGVADMRPFAEGSAVLRVPADAFAHTDPTAIVYLQARLANGAPLPGWLEFDGLRGLFSGTPPEGLEGNLEIEIVARDNEGREARTRFTLEIEALRAGPAAAALALGLDVDKDEAEKARLEAARQAKDGREAGKAGTATAAVRPQKPGASTFSDQVSAARTQRDPLLDRISPPGKDKTGTRR
jgi:hypothetical protein